MEIVVDILEEVENPGLLAMTAERAARLALEMAGAGDQEGELGIVLAGSQYVQGLNREYRGEDYDTDVLAFSMREPGEGEPKTELPGDILGDVVVSLPTAARQAGEYGHDLALEVGLLVAHGVLHLLGYRDDTPAGEELMWEKQREVLARLGGPGAMD
ncbi:MAG: rRNA maturation RNase YbeY [Bacillota bacterium]